MHRLLEYCIYRKSLSLDVIFSNRLEIWYEALAMFAVCWSSLLATTSRYHGAEILIHFI